MAEYLDDNPAHVDNLHEGEFPCNCGYVWVVKESCAPKTIICPMCGRVHKNPILSALSTAEQERDALAARCAELEAIPERLRKLDMSLCPEPHGEWSILDCEKEIAVFGNSVEEVINKAEAAILGEKKEATRA